MKITYLFSITFFILLFFIRSSFGQRNTCDALYTIVDQMPYYGKGIEETLKYISKYVKIHDSCPQVGSIILSFTVNKDGLITDVDAKGLEGACKTDLIEVIKKWPDWTPGKLNGKLVCVKMSIPIHIHLTN